ncbi:MULTISPECIES: L-serine ammonia-lyase [unclassified Thalassospira]|mgnify:FL=1|uniref:L-serine ammonia-lyase n=1 Tax=unclassified Thalassospira TaxID=2648997 RepID=UPI000C3AF389|nr:MULTISPECIES: L-serine ammonia-lyase [unclassified Thalassospira]MAZ35359.1 L-serine ammonia-lyase [Thalassospira sp.]MBO9507351.1 L-serine ammonia-lyase [Thalassospira sp. A3_1]
MTEENKQRPQDVNLSVVDLYTIGIGPSSSHTVGPMRAGYRFCLELEARNILEKIGSVIVDLYGSLALTGKGHATDTAVIMGLSGERPRSVDPDRIAPTMDAIDRDRELQLYGRHPVSFNRDTNLVFHMAESLPEHPNGMRITAFDHDGVVLHKQEYFSVGGGFIVSGDDRGAEYSGDNITLPYPFSSADELMAICKQEKLSIAEVMAENEKSWREPAETEEFVDRVHRAMMDCIERGCKSDGILPGGLNVKRRARKLYLELTERPEAGLKDPLTVIDWVNLYALAVNEENAAGSRVVTAPTNGAAGVIPAVLRYYERFGANVTQGKIREFLLTAAAIGSIYKKRASISAAEVGCQGEVGVACSMAAGALCAVMGGTPEQVENAAEIGMEHNLGLTCDPIGGLVQVPCIERNTMGAVKAINAARLAMRGDGQHTVSLDKVIETMRQTGIDMQSKYKETSQGGLAVNVNVVEC